jgi:hypothetical protein
VIASSAARSTKRQPPSRPENWRDEFFWILTRR